MIHDDISIMYLIKRHHPCNLEASYMESTSIIHGINKHHVINKRQECYSIIDNIASLIATFKRYALVITFAGPRKSWIPPHHKLSTLAVNPDILHKNVNDNDEENPRGYKINGLHK